MATSSSDSAVLLQALPDGDLRELAVNFRMEKLLKPKALREQYFELVRGTKQSADTCLGHAAPPHVVTDGVAVFVVLRLDFSKHIRKHGGADKLASDHERGRLALAAAGTVVARYFVEEALND